MKYTIRLFLYNDEIVFKEYEFDQMPYMPKIGETISIEDENGVNSYYIVKDILASFDQVYKDNYMVDYTIQEVCY